MTNCKQVIFLAKMCLAGPDISSIATPLPRSKWKGDVKQISAPSNGTPMQVSPLDTPTKGML